MVLIARVTDLRPQGVTGALVAEEHGGISAVGRSFWQQVWQVLWGYVGGMELRAGA